MAYLGKTPSQAVRSRFYFTASGGETSLAPAQVTGLSFTDANYVDVSLNGVALVSGTDYTATPSTNTISSLAALTASDVVEIVVYDTFSVFGGSVNGDFTISNGTLAAEAVTVTGLTTTGNINFGDSDKAIFGAGSDLNVWHNGSHSYVQDTGTGNLYLAGSNVIISNPTATETMAYFDDDGGASLWYNNAVKIATTNTGVDVTGSVTADGLDVDNLSLDGNTLTAAGTFTIDSSNIITLDSAFSSGNAGGIIRLADAGTQFGDLHEDSGNFLVSSAQVDKDLIFKGNDAGGIITALTLDMSDAGKAIFNAGATFSGNVGINTSSPDATAHLEATNASLLLSNSGRSQYFRLQNQESADAFTINANDTSERMRIDSSGNVGIGTSSPSERVTIGANSSDGALSGTSNTQGLHLYARNFGIAQIDSLANGSSNSGMSLRTYNNGTYTPFIQNLQGNTTTFATAGSERMRIDSSGRLGVGKTPDSSIGTVGFEANPSGQTLLTTTGQDVLFVNRKNNDGLLVRFFQDGSEEGNISVSGSTVSYNGGHLSRWSQATDGNRITGLVKGTVMTNLDQMAEWTKDGVTEENEQLNCMAVSSVEGDANVAGVFVNWDDDDTDFTADMNVAMTGDMVIRIASGTTVARGDLLMSAGDGTAKPQGDDIVRSRTIAKVTSTTVSHTYDDGTYLVPCVLMAC